MGQPLISVIVPVYNVEAYVHQCIESILCQTYRNLEIILIDDGSTDNCPAICDEYERLDSRIKVIHQKNSGQSVARNVGLDICRGEYIAFVDSDDWVEPNAYMLMMDMMLNKNLDIVFCTANIILDNESKEIRFEFFEDNTVLMPQKIVELTLKDEIGGQPWLKIYHRHCWEDVRFPEGRVYEDLAVSFRPFLNVKKAIGFLKCPLYNYRLNSQGTSLSFNPQKAYHIFQGFKEHYEYAKEHYNGVAEYCLFRTVNAAVNVYNMWVLGEKKLFDEAFETKQWIQENKSSILRCTDILLVKKISILVMLISSSAYRFLYSFYNGIKKVLGRNDEQ